MVFRANSKGQVEAYTLYPKDSVSKINDHRRGIFIKPKGPKGGAASSGSPMHTVRTLSPVQRAIFKLSGISKFLSSGK